MNCYKTLTLYQKNEYTSNSLSLIIELAIKLIIVFRFFKVIILFTNHRKVER